MGFIRNFMMTRSVRKFTRDGMRMMAQLRQTDPDMAPDAAMAIDHLGDELAVIARDRCATMKERTRVVEGMRYGLRDYGLSEVAILRILQLLTPRILSGRPESTIVDEVAAMQAIAEATGAQKAGDLSG